MRVDSAATVALTGVGVAAMAGAVLWHLLGGDDDKHKPRRPAARIGLNGVTVFGRF